MFKKTILLIFVLTLFSFSPNAFAEQWVDLNSPDPQIKIQLDIDSIRMHMSYKNVYMAKMQKLIDPDKAATMQDERWQKVTVLKSTEEIDYSKHLYRTLNFLATNDNDVRIISSSVPSKWRSFDNNSIMEEVEKAINDNKQAIEGRHRY